MATTEQVNVNVTDNGTADVVAARVAKVGSQADKSVGSVEGLNRALGMLAGAFAIEKMTKAIDTYNNMYNRLDALARRGQDTTKVFNDLYDVAQRTRAPFDATVNTFIRLDTSARTMGLSTEKVTKIVETLNKGLLLGGASAAETSAVLTQFAQGIGSGKFGGDELKSFAENATYMADKVAKAILGPSGTVAALRDMGKAGKLTSDVVAQAMLRVSKDVDAQFAKMTPTIGQSMTVLENAFSKFLYQSNQASGAAGAMASIILKLADNMPAVANGLLTVAAAYGAYRTAALVAATAQGIFNGAVVINPYVAVIAAIAGIVAWLYTYGSAIQIGAEKTMTLGAATSVAMGVVGKAFADAAVWVWGWVTAIASGAVKVGGYLVDVYNTVTGKFSTLWTWLTSGFDNMWKDVLKLWENVKSYIASWVDWAMDKLGGVVTVARVAAALGAAGQMVPAANATQQLAPMDNLKQFADGGSFTVGGSGGTDSQTVAFNASPGETVSITNPATTPGTTTNVINNVSGGFSDPKTVTSFTKPINDLGKSFTDLTGTQTSTIQQVGDGTVNAINAGASGAATGLVSINGNITNLYTSNTKMGLSTAKANGQLDTANGTLDSINSGVEQFGGTLGSGLSGISQGIGGLQNSIQSLASSSALNGATMSTNAFSGQNNGGLFETTGEVGDDLYNYNKYVGNLPKNFYNQIDWSKVPSLNFFDPGSEIQVTTAIQRQYTAWMNNAALAAAGGSSLAGQPASYGAASTNGNSFVLPNGTTTKLAGFATGGSFRVGGNGGTDSQIVAFRASPDETVSISTPDQAGGTVIHEMNLVFPNITDGDNLRRNRKQIIAGLKQELARVGN